MSSERHLAILGAGPTGLEAALAAAEAGWSFTLYEAGDEVAANMRDWGHVRLFSPWSLDVSPRMRSHQDRLGLSVPDDESCPTGADLRSRVFEPLASSAALAGHLQLDSRVVAISRAGLLKHEAIGTPERGRELFRLLVRSGDGTGTVETANAVFDCTGSYSQPNWLGDGGIPALGEEEATAFIVRRVPNFEREVEAWRGLRVLLVGAGHSAQTAAEGLAGETSTRVIWALRSPSPGWRVDPEDALPERSRLIGAANELVAGSNSNFEIRPGVVVERFEIDGEQVIVTLRGVDGQLEAVTVDRVLGLTGSVGDHAMYRQLQVHECFATSGPMKLAAALLSSGGGDCLAQESHGVDTLRNPEPNFFILGAKSYGRNTSFLMRVGWQQVDEVFELLAQADAA